MIILKNRVDATGYGPSPKKIKNLSIFQKFDLLLISYFIAPIHNEKITGKNNTIKSKNNPIPIK